LKTLSVYARSGEALDAAKYQWKLEEERSVRAYVKRLLDDDRIELPAATVVDVGFLGASGWAIVEQNAAWGAGLYSCDPDAALDVIRRATVSPSMS
jgi:hypothetical protein